LISIIFTFSQTSSSMFSSSSLRFVLVLAAAFHAVPSTADDGVPPPTPTVNLKTAKDFVILSKTGITTVPDSDITGDIGVSPIGSAAMTGFSFTKDTSGTTTSAQLGNGNKATAADDGGDDAKKLTIAVNAMEGAYTDAAGRPNADAARINLGAGILGGDFGGATTPLTPGVYTFSTDVNIPTDITFSGTDEDIFIIQIAGNLLLAANVILTDGAKAENIFWQVAGHVQVGAGAHLEGILLAKTAVTFVTGSSLSGRILAQTAVALQMATITQPPVEVLRRSLLRKGVLRE
jgi:hypothetical protein